MHNSCLYGNSIPNSGITIIELKKKYKKFAHNVAMPTPSSPNIGINDIVKTTFVIPESNFKINSI